MTLLFSLAVATTASPCALAEGTTRDREKARALGYSGIDAFDAGDYTRAARDLDDAFTTLKAPSLGLWSARAMIQLGKLVAARQRLLEVQHLSSAVGDPELQLTAQRDARTELLHLEPRIPSLRIEAQDCDQPRLSVDGGAARPTEPEHVWALDPGRHHVLLACEQGSATAHAELAEGEHSTLTLRPILNTQGPPQLSPVAPTSRPETSSHDNPNVYPRLGWVGVSVGGVGLLTAGIAGWVANEKLQQLRDDPACTGNVCDRDARTRVASYDTARSVATVSLVTGGVLLASGLALIVFSDRSPTTVALQLDTSGAHFLGAF